MPVHNNTRVSDRLRRWMGAKGPAAIDTVAPEIVPVVNVGDLSGQDIAAREEVYKMGYGVEAAAGGVYSHVQLFNPATSEVDLLVDAAWVNTGSGIIDLRIYDTALTGQSANVSTVDVPGKPNFTWAGGAADSIGQVRDQANAAVLGSVILQEIYIVSTVPTLCPLGIRLLPGRGIHFVPLTVNVAMRVSWAWREQHDVP